MSNFRPTTPAAVSAIRPSSALTPAGFSSNAGEIERRRALIESNRNARLDEYRPPLDLTDINNEYKITGEAAQDIVKALIVFRHGTSNAVKRNPSKLGTSVFNEFKSDRFKKINSLGNWKGKALREYSPCEEGYYGTLTDPHKKRDIITRISALDCFQNEGAKSFRDSTISDTLVTLRILHDQPINAIHLDTITTRFSRTLDRLVDLKRLNPKTISLIEPHLTQKQVKRLKKSNPKVVLPVKDRPETNEIPLSSLRGFRPHTPDTKAKMLPTTPTSPESTVFIGRTPPSSPGADIRTPTAQTPKSATVLKPKARRAVAAKNGDLPILGM